MSLCHQYFCLARGIMVINNQGILIKQLKFNILLIHLSTSNPVNCSALPSAWNMSSRTVTSLFTSHLKGWLTVRNIYIDKWTLYIFACLLWTLSKNHSSSFNNGLGFFFKLVKILKRLFKNICSLLGQQKKKCSRKYKFNQINQIK